ncbi:MAG: hypothetical protein ABI035_13580 [Gemmatimonadaceae bacterium]
MNDLYSNAAGVSVISGGVLNETEQDWDTVIATNLHATFLLSKIAATSIVGTLRFES